VLEVKAIDTYRGPAHILHGVSLEVGPQEVVCLVGRNGAGKTTTIESIMGFLPLSAGEIVFQGESIGRLPPHERAKRGIGFSPEDCGVFPELSVDENLMIGRWLGEDIVRRRGRRGAGDGAGQGAAKSTGKSADPQEQAFAVFPEVRGLLARQGLHLSGGQRKMVAVARAMMLSPTLLLLDEAFEGLAPVVVNRFTEAVLKIKAMGVSILMAESHLAAASRIGDRLYAIDRGEIIFHGPPQAALADERVMRALRG
jgi:branched-chain amino acid transport system ATP-binding protein